VAAGRPEKPGSFAEKTDDGGPSVEGEKEGKSARGGERESGSPAVGHPVRDTDPIVSNSESRDNLPDNQNGPGHSSAPTEAVPASTGGTTSAKGTPDSGKSGTTANGTASETDGTR
jgi:hypothetical protein